MNLDIFVTSTTWISFGVGLTMLALAVYALIFHLDSNKTVVETNSDQKFKITGGLVVDDNASILVSSAVKTHSTFQDVQVSTSKIFSHPELPASIKYSTTASKCIGTNYFVNMDGGIIYRYTINGYGEAPSLKDSFTYGTSGSNTALVGNYLLVTSGLILNSIDLNADVLVAKSATNASNFSVLRTVGKFRDSDYCLIANYVNLFSYSFFLVNVKTPTTVYADVGLKTYLNGDASSVLLYSPSDTEMVIFVGNTFYVGTRVGNSVTFTSPIELYVSPTEILPNLSNGTVGLVSDSLNMVGTITLFKYSNKTLIQGATFPFRTNTISDLLKSQDCFMLDDNGMNLSFDKYMFFSKTYSVKIIDRFTRPIVSYMATGLLFPILSSAGDFMFLSDSSSLFKVFADVDIRQIFYSETHGNTTVGTISNVSGDVSNLRLLSNYLVGGQKDLYPGMEYYYNSDDSVYTTERNPKFILAGIAISTDTLSINRIS
jgi:hypothetical protein